MNVVFIFNEFSLHNHIIEAYVRARPHDKVSVVKVPLVLRGKSRSQTAQRILPKLSRRFIWSKFQEFLTILFLTLIPKILAKGAIFRRLRSIAERYSLPFHSTDNVMSEETLSFIREQNPDIILTLFHQIIRKKLIEIPRQGIINLHPGILPEFRGIQPYFWELQSGFNRAGVTLHYIADESVDTGDIVAKASYKIPDKISVQLNYYLTTLSAAHILPLLAKALEANSLHAQVQTTDVGHYYTWPDSKSVDQLYERGHMIVCWKDLFDVLNGKYDKFQPDEVVIHKSI